MGRTGCAYYREVSDVGHTLGIRASFGQDSRLRKPRGVGQSHSDGNRVRGGAAPRGFWQDARDRISKTGISIVVELYYGEGGERLRHRCERHRRIRWQVTAPAACRDFTVIKDCI